MEKEIKYHSKRIFYRVVGSGKTVLLIHGFGEDGNIWNLQVEYLQNKFRLIVPDLPGSGRSELVDDMSIEGMAEVIKAIIDQEIKAIDPTTSAFAAATAGKPDSRLPTLDSRFPTPNCILLGHSMGGYITLAFAEKYPNYLKGFGLIHSTAFSDTEEKKETRRKGIVFIQEHGSYEFLKTATPNLFSENSKNQPRLLSGPNSIQDLIEQGNNFSPDSLVSYYEGMMQRPDRTAVLRQSSVPVLFIMGKYDTAVPLDDVLKQCHLPEKSYIHILHQTGHMGMLEEAEKTNRVLEKFLEEI